MLQFACVKSPVETVRELLNAGAQVNYQGGPFHTTALTFAAKYGRVEVCNVLLEAGADIPVVDDMGRTTFMHACNSGKLDVLQTLLDHVVGFKKYYIVNMKDLRGRSVLSTLST